MSLKETQLTEYSGRVICGNNIDVLRKISSNSVDSIVTDPP